MSTFERSATHIILIVLLACSIIIGRTSSDAALRASNNAQATMCVLTMMILRRLDTMGRKP